MAGHRRAYARYQVLCPFCLQRDADCDRERHIPVLCLGAPNTSFTKEHPTNPTSRLLDSLMKSWLSDGNMLHDDFVRRGRESKSHLLPVEILLWETLILRLNTCSSWCRPGSALMHSHPARKIETHLWTQPSAGLDVDD